MSTDIPQPTATALFSLQEIAELMIKHQKIHSGQYDLMVEFSIGTGAVGPAPDKMLPGAMVGISKLGLVKSVAPGVNTVDAAICNPQPQRRTSKSK